MSQFDYLKSDCIGRWVDIFANLGVEVGDGRHCKCPICGQPGKSPPFRFDDQEGTGSWICTNCNAGDGWALLMKVFNLTLPEAAYEVRKIIHKCEIRTASVQAKASPENLRSVFLASAPVKPGDPAWRYLINRGITKIPMSLRYTSQCWCSETRKKEHAMLAVFMGPDNQGVTIHQTYLTEEGKKMDIAEPKRFLPALKKMLGGAVRLWPSDNRLGVGEGVETMLAASEQTGIPTWATLTSSLLVGFEPPPGVVHLYIFGDNDKNYAGQRAAYTLANRIMTSPKHRDLLVSVYIPDKDGLDWADVLVLENTAKIFKGRK